MLPHDRREGDLGGGFSEELLHFYVREDDVRGSLQGFIIATLEAIAFFRRTNEGAHFRYEMLDLDGRGFHLLVEEFIDAYD